MPKKDLITIAIPVFNEVAFEALVDSVYSLKLNTEVLIVDDGSTFTQTRACLNNIRKKHSKVRILTNKKNIGKARSIQRAIKEARGNYFVILDADYELDPQDIVPLFKRLKNTDAALVNGNRVLARKADGEKFTSRFSFFSKLFMSVLTRILYGKHIKDVFCGYKMFATEIFRKHKFASERFGLETELIVETIRQGKHIAEVDVHYYPRSYKQGKKINLLDSIEILWVLFKKSSTFTHVKNVLVGGLIAVVAFVAFTWSMDFYPTTDSLPNNFTALNIIQEGRIDLDNYDDALEDRGIIAVTVENEQGIRFSKTPPILGVLSAPMFYVLNHYFGVESISPLEATTTDYTQFIGKITASFYAALSAALLYFLALTIFKKKDSALLSTIMFIFATGVFNVISQANWQHAVSLFFILLFLNVFVHTKRTLFSGLVLGMLGGLFWQIRISNAFYLAFPIVYYALQLKNKKAFLIAYMFGMFGAYSLVADAYSSLQVPYGYGGELLFSLKIWTPVLFVQNMISVLLSYNLGLFFAYPVLLFSIVGIYAIMKKPHRLLASLLPTLILFIVFVSSWWAWSGGRANNARLLSEALPIFVLLAVYGYNQFKPKLIVKALFVAAFAFSIFTNILTVYARDFSYYDHYFDNGHGAINRNAWYHEPTLYEYLIKNEMLTRTTLITKEDGVYRRDRVYRPSLKYRGIVKLFDGERPVLIQE